MVTSGLSCTGGFNRVLHPREESWTPHVCHHSTLRGDRPGAHQRARQEGRRDARPEPTELPGFNGYFLIEAGNGVLSSIGFYDTAEHADESTRVATNWVREQKLEEALPNTPKITTGEILVQKTGELVQA